MCTTSHANIIITPHPRARLHIAMLRPPISDIYRTSRSLPIRRSPNKLCGDAVADDYLVVVDVVVIVIVMIIVGWWMVAAAASTVWLALL